MACPQCGSEILGTVAAHYMAEVRKPGADPQAMDAFAPPSRKAVLHGSIFFFLAWIGMLAPFFAPEGTVLRTSLPIWILALIWFPLFWRGRAQDRASLAAYQARRFCSNCGWYDKA
jgi:hypothetical protein